MCRMRGAPKSQAIIIDGSYVTGKAEPNDIDLLLGLRPDFDLSGEIRPLEYNVVSKRMVRQLYRFDILVAVDGSDAFRNTSTSSRGSDLTTQNNRAVRLGRDY